MPGLAWAELCPDCRTERLGRARRLSLRISLLATALMAAYVAFRAPVGPIGRFYAVVSVVATYIIMRRIVTRLATEWLPRDAAPPEGPSA